MKWLIDQIIEASVRNRFIVFLGTAALIVGGFYALNKTPVDAIPDLSENQVIVWADWMGRSPKEVEEQVTYPLSVNLQGLAGIKSVRATSEFGFSMINIIFDEHIDFYFARQRVLERLSIASGFLPQGVVPYLAPDATALGQIFWYTVEGEGKSLDELRAIQDWYVRYQLNSVPGVAEVSSVGGFVREYQVDVDPEKLRAYDISLGQVFRAVMASNSSVGGKVIHKNGAEYLVRGYGWIRGLEDIRKVVVTERRGVPITVDQLGVVQLGPAFRRSVLEKDGREAVGAVVMMRYGENPLEITERIKVKIQELQAGLPAGVRIVPFYDRTGLIHASIETLTGTLVEEIVVASLVVLLVLWHLRSAIAICITLPLAVLASFIFMYLFKIPSNIMSLSGIAISIGVLVDSGIVITENAYHRLCEHFKDEPVTGDTRELIIEACKVVGSPLVFSILIMLLSFAPIFVLGGIEGKMFNPLAYTKSFALIGVAILAISLVPAILPMLLRGRLKSQEEVWLVRSFAEIYRPMLRFFLDHPDVIVITSGFFMLFGLKLFPLAAPWGWFPFFFPFVMAIIVTLVARHKIVCTAILLLVAMAGWHTLPRLGQEFMPPLEEMVIMDMPITTPNINISQAGDNLKERDQILRSFPEVHQIVGKVGRAETPTDPAPIDMVETVVSFRPAAWWPKRKIFYDEILAEGHKVAKELERRGLLKPGTDHDLINSAAMTAAVKLDQSLRELSKRRFVEYVPAKGRELILDLRARVLAFLESKHALHQRPDEKRWEELVDRLAVLYAPRFNEWILQEDISSASQELINFLIAEKAIEDRPDHLVDTPDVLERVLESLGRRRLTIQQKWRQELEEKHNDLMTTRVRQLNWELQDYAPGVAVWHLIEEMVAEAKTRNALIRESSTDSLFAARDARIQEFRRGLFLWQKSEADVRNEMDSELQVPGWGNIWTRPIINRVDMLATGVRTMVGVKVFGPRLEDKIENGKVVEKGIQTVSNEIAAVLKQIRGAVDVFPDQIVGENYLEIMIDREKAARYGVSIEAIQQVIEVALGGRMITTTVEGRQRFPVRVRYPREYLSDEERVKGILVNADTASVDGGMDGGGANAMSAMSASSAAAGGRLRQVPLSLVADITVIPGPSMIKSENGSLRAYVQLNVRERDIVGFVEEAQQAVASKVKLPPGFHVEWSGQFEHQVNAQKKLLVVFPLVILIIFVVLYMTYKDFSDTFMMFLSVPGAIAGGALFQWMLPAVFGLDVSQNFSVAVWVGYIACFGLATETGIVMLVYLRESIDRRGGMERIASEAEIREAVMEGAVNRLRPKLLTEGTTIIALVPMLWATGVGHEFMSPMALPILGGILVADEVIDLLIPVLFYFDRCRRLRRRLDRSTSAATLGESRA